jgi:hypothetical protein
MKVRGFWLLHLLAAGSLSVAAAAGDFSLNVPKGQSVVVKIPHSTWTREKLNAASGQPIYTVEVDNNFLAARKWEQGEMPFLAEFRLEKTEDCGRMRYDCKMKGYRQAELRAPGVWIKLRFAPDVSDVNAAFRELVALGTVADFEGSDYFKTKVYAAQVPRIFVGPLADLSDPAKWQLFLMSLHSGAERMASETYKNKSYLVVQMGETANVYNSLRLNQSARVAKQVNETLLDLLKKFGSALPENSALYGIKLEQNILFKDFTRENDPDSIDHLQIYAPAEFIRKFSDADITNQQFIDACSVLLNDNRIQVNLSVN